MLLFYLYLYVNIATIMFLFLPSITTGINLKLNRQLKEAIIASKVIPESEGSTVQALISQLNTCGLTDVEDLILMKEEHLLPAAGITPVLAQKLIRAWKHSGDQRPLTLCT